MAKQAGNKMAKGTGSKSRRKKPKTLPEKLLERKVTRKQFVKAIAVGIGGLATGIYAYPRLFRAADEKVFRGDAPEELWKWSKEAYFYKKTRGGIICTLCPHNCFLAEGDRGICRVRVNKEEKLYTLAYGNPCAVHLDPVEKKPLFHFLPSTTAFSIATAGCNLRCLNCQNWEISQSRPEDVRFYDMMPEKVVSAAQKAGSRSIAYTYSEPAIWYEYMLDTSGLAKKQGLKNLWITAGYLNEKPLRKLCRVIDAANVDLKGFDDDIYVKLNGAHLKPVLNTLKILKEEGVWIEITNLVVPHWTDNLDMIGKMSRWLVREGFSDYPLHFSRFHPMYKLTHIEPTPVEFLEKARKTALEAGMKFVYIGNVPGHEGENTYCPGCGKLLIRRKGYEVTENHIKGGKCAYCSEPIAGVWEA